MGAMSTCVAFTTRMSNFAVSVIVDDEGIRKAVPVKCQFSVLEGNILPQLGFEVTTADLSACKQNHSIGQLGS